MATSSARLAIVTGASSGIGEALARLLSARGTPVLAVARRRERLEALAMEAREAGHAEILPLAADLAEPGGPDEVAATARRLGVPALLVNNAGVGAYGRFEEQDPARLGALLRLNCEALLLLTHALLPDLVAAGDGAVLNVASTAGLAPTPFMAAYGASKAFVVSLSEALDEELRPRGVRVLAFCPGPVDTEFGEVAGVGERFVQSPGRLTAEQAARAALAQLDAREVVAVPGAVYQAVTLLPRVLPRRLVRLAAGRFLRPAEER